MNHTYRLVWNDAEQCQAPAPENARGRGKSAGVKPLATAILAAFACNAYALPTGGAVTAGSGSIAQSGTTTTVSQSSRNLAINWQSFGVGANERVNFNQPNASAIVLNRVLGSDPSQIHGQLNGNGQVWVLNPNGVLFGRGAQVNVGGLLASTLSMSDADFLAGKRSFSSLLPQAGEGAGVGVVNQGSINASSGGYVALLGGQVSNEGVITAQLGTVALAAGKQITLDFNGDKLLNVQVEQGALDALTQNKQLIRADGGTVLMTAQAADALATAVVNNSGVIEARSIENHNGVIKLLGDMQNGTVNVGGTLDASALVGAASAANDIRQQAGSYNGGFIETSAAHVQVADNAQVTTAAFNGLAGNWLIDPIDFTIASGSGALTTSGIGASTLATNLGGGNIAIATNATTAGNGDIFVNSAVSWSANKLTLTAHRNIAINANLNGSGTASLALEYGQNAVAAGNAAVYSLNNGAKVYLPAGANFSTKLGSDGATTPWTVITSLGAAGDATVAPGIMSLQGMKTGLAGNYVLGADIDACLTGGNCTSGATPAWNAGAGFTPVGQNGTNFTGKFDGLGHTISGLKIDLSGGNFLNYGMFGDASNAVLQNVGLLNVNIKGGSNGMTGALAGAIRGTTAVRNCYVDGGSVSTATQIVGGLVGAVYNPSTISYSYANVSVSAQMGGGAGYTAAGGLAGINLGAISYSYATGSVSAPANNSNSIEIGGLVGRQSAGSISNSYATGAVSGFNTLGGLVGNKSGGTVTGSYWNKTTTNQNNNYSGGGTTGGLATNEWSTIGPFGSSPSNGAWSTADWGTGNPYPGIKALPYITITANASQTYGSAASIGIGSILDQSGANASGLVNTGSLAWQTDTTAASPPGTTGRVRGSGASATGYQILYTGSLTVGKANLTVVASSASKTYDGLAWSGNNGVSYSGFVNGDGAGTLGGALAYGGSAQGAVNAGSYLITPSGLSSGSYSISYVSGALTVNPAPLTVTTANVIKTYDGTTKATGTPGVVAGTLFGSDSLSGGIFAFTDKNAGVNKTVVTSGVTINDGNSGKNYAVSYADNTTSTINKAALTVSANAAAKTYDGLAYSGNNGVSYSGLANGETSAVLGGALAYGGTAQGAVNAGSYTITPGGLTSGNYTIGYVNGALTVNPAPLTVTTANVIKAYDGTTRATGTPSVVAGALFGSDSLSGGIYAFTDKNAGANKTVTLSGVAINDGNGGNNYTVSYVDNTSSTINQAALTVTANAAGKTYDGLAWSGNNGVTYSGLANGETGALLGGALTWGGTAQGAVNAGSYTLIPGGLSSSNYRIVYVNGALTVNPAPLTVTANAVAKTYDGRAWSGNNGVTYSGFVNGETAAVLGGALAYGGTAQGAINAGSYVIRPGGLTGGNYAISYADGALTVNPAPLAVTANAASKIYNGLAYSGGNGVSYSGLVNGETAALLGGALAYGGTSQGAVNAGSYVISPSGLTSGNYAINYVNGALTVNPAALSVNAIAANKTYDGLAYGGGNGVSYSGLVNGETAAALGGALAYGGTAQGAIKAGSYSIIPGGLSSGNYRISYGTGTLTVNPAPLSVSANAANKTYDGLAYSGGNGVAYSGFVNGETAAVLGGALAWGGTAQGAVNAGSYLITPSGLTSGNYAINYVNGALAVNAAPLAVTANSASKIYNGLAYSGGNGVSYSGLVNGETSAVLGGALAWGGTAQGAVNEGDYTLVPGGLSSGNYSITYNDGKLHIGARVPAIPGAPINGYSGAIASTGAIAAGIGAGTGAAGNTAAGASVVALAVESGESAASGQSESGVVSLSAAGVATDYFSTRYVLVMHDCGLRLPTGLSCR